MDFVDFVKENYRDTYDASLNEALPRLVRALDRAEGGLRTLLNNDDAAVAPFPPATLIKLADAYRDYLEWKEAAKAVRRSLAQSRLALPDGSLSLARTPFELTALERTLRMCQRASHADHDQWAAAVKAHIDLWRASIELSLAHGSATVAIADPKHPDAEEFSAYASRKLLLAEIRGYRWLAIRRGERAGILSITLVIPEADIIAQTEARLASLGLVAKKRGAASIADELALQDIEPTVRAVLDRRSERGALESARNAYISLLGAPPLQAELILTFYVGNEDAPTGFALLDRKGDVKEQEELAPDTDPEPIVKRILEQYHPEVVILPLQAPAAARLRRIESLIGSLPVQRILTAAVSDARKNLPHAPAVGAAVVLARRALKPGREWGRVDPLSLKLGEYPREIPTEKLKETLVEAKSLSSWERRRRTSSPKKSALAGRPAATLASAKRLNPLVKTIRDLKPGMTVEGIITNLTRFGAFVNIGIGIEGMIHVSQLAADFVDDPSEVVSVGQQVTARILEVVPEKQRIALSLKPISVEALRESIVSGREGARTRQPPKSRSAALADLDALFKK